MSYARIAYHYARPGVTDDHQVLMPGDLHLPLLPENWQPAARMGARNSVFFAAETIVSDRAMTHLDQGRLWAEGQLLVWTPKTKGDKKAFTFSIDSGGKKQVNVTLAMTPRSGSVAFFVDGEPVGDADLYRSYRTLHRNVPLKPLELAPGDHTLTVALTRLPKDGLDAEIGIDFIWVQNK